jgi:Acyl-coenzyme A synthetases/AMP-(fatty) acid ligases
VINVADHRLGTRKIEESVATYTSVAEAAVIGMKDELKGQVPVVFATLKQGVVELPADVARAMQQCVTDQLGAVAKPALIYVVNALSKTRSGKLLRRSLQALVQHTDPGALDDVRKALERGPDLRS